MLCGYLFVILSLIVSFVQPQSPPACVQEITQKPGFMECMGGFVNFMKNAGEAAGGAPGGAANDGATGVMKMMCSPEGKAAMACMIEYMKDCPEISKQAGGMDLSAIMNQGGLDAACAILVGPCASVQQCLVPSGKDDMSPEGGMDMSAMANNNNNNGQVSVDPYPAFIMQATMICGPMRKQYDCIIQHLDKCADEVKKIEEMFKNSLDALMQGEHALGSYDDMKKFMNEECKNMPAKLSEDQCIMESLSSSGFKGCYSNATNTYSMKKDKKDDCTLYDLQSVCLDTHVGKCGMEKTAFMKNNMNRIIKNVPASCTVKDTSAAVRNVQLATTSIVMLAVSLFFVL